MQTLRSSEKETKQLTAEFANRLKTAFITYMKLSCEYNGYLLESTYVAPYLEN